MFKGKGDCKCVFGMSSFGRLSLSMKLRHLALGILPPVILSLGTQALLTPENTQKPNKKVSKTGKLMSHFL